MLLVKCSAKQSDIQSPSIVSECRYKLRQGSEGKRGANTVEEEYRICIGIYTKQILETCELDQLTIRLTRSLYSDSSQNQQKYRHHKKQMYVDERIIQRQSWPIRRPTDDAFLIVVV